MWIKNHEDFYEILLEKYDSLLQKNGFRKISDKIFEKGIARTICYVNESCNCKFYFNYERGGFEIYIMKEDKNHNKAYDLWTLGYFLEKVKKVRTFYFEKTKKDGDINNGPRELFFIYSDLLNEVIEKIVFIFKDENYQDFEIEYQDFINKILKEENL
ncbi:MAG: hypothetical protein HPY78_10250 [Brevinematales bacterium]|nr:hypothetical protein [Brevinematales bacterium]